MRLASTALLGALALGGAWQNARAARSYDACTGYIDSLPATISTSGHWCLRKDLATGITQGTAITVAANNVTLDCNDFKLVGVTAGPNTLTHGIVASGRANTTVRNCVVRGFLVGLQLTGNGHVVEDNLLDANTDHGIWITGDDALIRRNRILDT